jgi:hypothetical protein
VYLTWVDSVFLAFLAFNEINNLRVFNVAFSSIPTTTTGFSHSLPRACEFLKAAIKAGAASAFLPSSHGVE